jgi:hypothetical protein
LPRALAKRSGDVLLDSCAEPAPSQLTFPACHRNRRGELGLEATAQKGAGRQRMLSLSTWPRRQTNIDGNGSTWVARIGLLIELDSLAFRKLL